MARDDGFGLVEAVVALLLLALVMVPVTRVALATTGVSNADHLRIEAADLANETLSQVNFAAEQGQSWTEGVTTSTERSGSDAFNVAVDVEPTDASVLCSSGGTPQAWSAQATVSWGGGSEAAAVASGDDVVESTIIPAPSSTQATSGYGEIAIPVYGPDGSLLTAAPISVTLTGSCTGTSCAPATGSGAPYATETRSTGSSGCAVFTELDAGEGWTYQATITNSNGYVDPSEHSSGTGANDPVLSTTLTSSVGSITTVPAAGAFSLAPANPVEIEFSLTAFAGTSGPLPAAAVPVLPVTVTPAAGGPCAAGCTLGDGSTSFNGTQQALLYPGASSGPTDDYSGWAGGAWADPSASTYCGAGTTSCPSPTAFDSASGSVTFPVYPLMLDLPASADSTALSLTPVGTEITIPLEGAGASGASVTGLPLGEYQMGSSSGLDLPSYLWITPEGVCSWSVTTAPMAPCASPSTAPLTVTAS